MLNQVKPPEKRNKKINSNIVARGAQIIFMFLFLGLVLFFGAGSLKWTAAWVYLGISLISVVINAFFMLRTSPETVVERGRPKGWRDWDKLVGGSYGVLQFLVLPLVAALDLRFHWTGEIGRTWQSIGALVYALSLELTSWAMVSNAYFSTAARIQTERGQQVCRAGPYQYIRHPGYAGAIIQSIGIAILLGSLWALIPAFAAGVLIIIRTVLEDRMLQNELSGYREYSHEVKYRLLPGAW